MNITQNLKKWLLFFRSKIGIFDIFLKRLCKESSEDFEFNSNRKIQTRAALSHKMVSSNIDEVIRSVLNFLFFLQKDFTSIKKHKTAYSEQK